MEEPILRTKRFGGYFYRFAIAFIGYFLLIGFSLIIAILTTSWSAFTILACSLGPICILILIYIFGSFNVYQVYNDRIQVISFLGREKRVFPLKEVIRWTEDELGGWGQSIYILTLYANTEKLKIRSSVLGDVTYEKVKDILTAGIKEDIPFELRKSIKQRKRTIIILWFFVAIIILLGIGYGCTYLNDLSNGRFTTINTVLSKKIFVNATYKHQSGWLSLNFKDNKDSILLDGYAFEATNVNKFVDSVQVGDSIFIDKVNSQPSNIITRIFGGETEYCCGLRSGSHTFLYFKTFNEKRFNSNLKGLYFIIFLMVCFLVAITYRVMRIHDDKEELEHIDKA